ncbi:hypothetical protein TWF281_001132 [Arthrobotrys megalospora]
MTMQDHYAILGVPVTASENDIKAAYRTKAMITHPDKNGNTRAATEEFQKVQAAHECLKDPQKRREYDRIRKPSPGFNYNTTTPTSTSRETPFTPTNAGTYTTPPDIVAEEARFFQKWRSHNIRKSSIENAKLSVNITKVKMADLKRQMAAVNEEVKKREEARKYQTTRSWLGRMMWGNIVLTEEEVSRNDAEDRESSMKINSLRIKIAKVEAELKSMEGYQEEWEKWDRQDAVRQAEERDLKMKKMRRKAADEAEARRKAEEERKERERKAREEERERFWKAQEAERVRKAQEEAERRRKAQEEVERRRKAQEEAEKRRKAREKEMEEQRKAQQQEYEKRFREWVEKSERTRRQAHNEEEEEGFMGRPRQQRHEARNRQARRPTGTQNSNTSSTLPTAGCTHQGWWKMTPISSEKCTSCHKTFSRFLFQCPGCQTKACSNCREQLKGNRPRNQNRRNERARRVDLDLDLEPEEDPRFYDYPRDYDWYD